MVWCPAASDEVEKEATPLVNAAVPSVTPPSIKVTVSPLGGTGVTVAVKVMDCPVLAGLAEEITVMAILEIVASQMPRPWVAIRSKWFGLWMATSKTGRRGRPVPNGAQVAPPSTD